MTPPLPMLGNGVASSATTLVLAHGAGAPMDSDFMTAMAERLAEHDVEVLRFEFPYMRRTREDGKRRPPDRQPVLCETWQAVVEQVRGRSEPIGKLVIGGKSMGGRVASVIADEANVDGLLCLGYPFHPVGKPEKLRIDHLETMTTPALILQGERDPFGRREELDTYLLSPKIQVRFLDDGDHSFKPRKASRTSLSANLRRAAQLSAEFLRGL